MSITDAFKFISARGKTDLKEVKVTKIREGFEKYRLQSPTGVTVPITRKQQFPNLKEMDTMTIIVNDIVRNDKRALDEKYVKVRHDADVGVGCYFYMHDVWWLLQFEDVDAIDTYKGFTARRCNQYLKYKYKGVIYDIPISIENLTMYSDGLAEVKYGTSPDTKRNIWAGANEITTSIKIGLRLMLTNLTVFTVTTINDFETNADCTGEDGLFKFLCSQTLLLKEDDKDNNIAWNGDDDTSKIDKEGIRGDDELYIGSTNTYESLLGEDVKWRVDTDLVELKDLGNGKCTITVSGNISLIGNGFKLYVCDAQDNILSQLLIKIRGF